jgi:hypothetical protein
VRAAPSRNVCKDADAYGALRRRNLTRRREVRLLIREVASAPRSCHYGDRLGGWPRHTMPSRYSMIHVPSTQPSAIKNPHTNHTSNAFAVIIVNIDTPMNLRKILQADTPTRGRQNSAVVIVVAINFLAKRWRSDHGVGLLDHTSGCRSGADVAESNARRNESRRDLTLVQRSSDQQRQKTLSQVYSQPRRSQLVR